MTKYDPKITKIYGVHGKTRLVISGVCPVTLKAWSVSNVDQNGWEEYLAGADINEVLPNLSRENRVLLTDGILPSGWDLLLDKNRSEELPEAKPEEL